MLILNLLVRNLGYYAVKVYKKKRYYIIKLLNVGVLYNKCIIYNKLYNIKIVIYNKIIFL